MAYELFRIISNNTSFKHMDLDASNPWIDNLHRMISFIQQNYDCKISLQDIANSGNVCRSKCCEIFKDLISQSPNNYLICHRINKSIELLINTSMSITDIALACGFSNSSYYAETFKKIKGCSPKQYKMDAI